MIHHLDWGLPEMTMCWKDSVAFVRGALAVAVLGLVLGVLADPNSALGDATPLWSDPITTTSWSAEGAAGREALFTNPLQKGYLDTVTVINADGTTEYQAGIEGQTIPPALAADGSGYVLRGEEREEAIEAITSAGAQRWRSPLPAGDAVRALAVGSDGAAYVGVSTTSGAAVLRLSPVDGSVSFDTPLPSGDGEVKELLAEPSGVAIGTNGDSTLAAAHVLFLAESGQIVRDVKAAPADEPDFYTSNNAGDVFIGYAPLKNGAIDYTKGLWIAEVTPNGKVAWKKRTPRNRGSEAPPIVAALTSGGVAFDLPSGSLGVLAAGGTIAWSHETEDYPMVADASGHIDLVSLVNNAICFDGDDNCDGFDIQQLSAADGTLQNSVSVVGSADPSRSDFNGGLAVGPGRVYLLCSAPAYGSWEPCASGEQLQAYAVPDTAGPYPTPPATTETTESAPSAAYVALGDSYSSGEGNPPYEDGTNTEGEVPDRCHRSAAAYGPLLDHELGLGSMVFKACSGAVTNDIFEASHTNLTEPAQRSWLQPDTKTVTLTIGGNDAGFRSALKECISFPPRIADCSTDDELEQETQARLDALAGGPYATTPAPLSEPIHSILSVIEAVHKEASNARIYVGLYPQLFGKDRAKYSKPLFAPTTLACGVGPNLWVTYNDATWLDQRRQQLDRIIANAVGTARDQGIAVTSVKPTGLDGHGFCDKYEPWFYPIEVEGAIHTRPELELVLGAQPGSFHPTASGQLAYEAAFAAKVR